MKTEIGNMGGSLPVQNVQALAAKELKQIPDRYIRPELQYDSVSVDDSTEIPVIDLGRLLDERFSSDELAKLHSACQDWGFFQLINHGVSEGVVDKMKIDIQEFFRLPLEEKKAYAQPPNNIEGYGQAFVVSEEQKLDWGDMLFLRPLPIHEKNMRLWPQTPTSFRGTLEKYSSEMERIAICLLGLMAKNLGIEPAEKFLTNMFENCHQGLRMNYYPPCPHSDKVLGLSPHSDATALTLLIQVNDVEGLQIRKKGSWIPVKPISGAVVVNIGDVMEILSNGKYKSIEHRAIINSEKERLSIAAFHAPKFSTMIGPLPDVVQESREHYKTIPGEDYIKYILRSKLDGKSSLDFMKLE